MKILGIVGSPRKEGNTEIMMTEALEAARDAGDRPGEAECHVDLGATRFEMGEFKRARLHFEQAVAAFEELGDARGFTLGRANLAAADLLLGRPQEAEQTLLACLEADRARGAHAHAAYDEKFLARAALVRGAVACARERLARAERVFRGLADDLPLDIWLNEHIFPAESAHINPEHVRWGSLLACAEMLLSGITACCDGYFYENTVAEAVKTSGLRAVLAQGIIDFPAPGVPQPEQNIQIPQTFAAKWHNPSALITPSTMHVPARR